MTTPNIPHYFIGTQVAVMALTGQTADATGAVTNGTPTYDLASLGVLDKATFQFTVRHEEISPCTTLLENEVIVGQGYTIDLEEIIPVGGQSNILAAMMSFDYFKLVFNASSAGSGYTGTAKTTAITVYGVRGDARYEVNKGKSIATLQLKTCGIPITVTTSG